MADGETPFSITASHTLQSPEQVQICTWLREYNWQANHSFMDQASNESQFETPLLLLARKEDAVVGGLIANKRLTWLRISIMAVDPKLRGQGIGSQLIAEAERWGKEHSCCYLYVDTMQYQSPEFYRQAGFNVVGELPDWDSHGHTKFFLMKSI